MNWLPLFSLLAFGTLIEAQYPARGQYPGASSYNPYANAGYANSAATRSNFPAIPRVPKYQAQAPTYQAPTYQARQYQAPQYQAPKSYSASAPTFNFGGSDDKKPKVSFGDALAAHQAAVQAQQAFVQKFTKNYGLDIPYQYEKEHPQARPRAPGPNAAPASFPAQYGGGPINNAPKKVHKPAEVFYTNLDPSLQGNYKFGYHTGGKEDNSFREESRLKDGTVVGAYGYVDAYGKTRIIKYTAGTGGFRILGEGQKAQAAARPQASQAKPQQVYHEPRPAQNYNQGASASFGLSSGGGSQPQGPKLSYTESLALHARQLAAQGTQLGFQ